MNKKNILFSTVFPLTIAGASLVTALPLSISNNSNVVVKNSSLTANISNNINATD
ncbi:hypothetical protein FACS189459_1920 [Bacilli bacterium]|nr:hypothetical protein FACS189459_1920 [Bacilli bacterium]